MHGSGISIGSGMDVAMGSNILKHSYIHIGGSIKLFSITSNITVHFFYCVQRPFNFYGYFLNFCVNLFLIKIIIL